MSLRITRSQSRSNTPLSIEQDPLAKDAKPSTTSKKVNQLSHSSSALQIPVALLQIDSNAINELPQDLKRKHTKLNTAAHSLLLLKQQRLRDLNLPSTCQTQERYGNRSSTSRKKHQQLQQELDKVPLDNAVAATLIFASDSAGTAVCIHESGLILTCAHCIAESQGELETSVVKAQKLFWLLTAGGQAVSGRCVAWDDRRDLALLQVVAAQHTSTHNTELLFHALAIASAAKTTAPVSVVCIGHPGSEDLESDKPALTNYPVLAISEGQFLGYAPDQEVQDNHEIGALMHDAWTYWGHSGAPLVGADGLVGLHSSWDDETGIRRGVGGEAIEAFLSDVAGRKQVGGTLLLL